MSTTRNETLRVAGADPKNGMILPCRAILVGPPSGKLVIAAIPSKVVSKYARDNNLSLGEAEQHMQELARFLAVCAAFPGQNAPSRVLDEAWHSFVLFTREYHEYCVATFGRFIHHAPTGCTMNESYRNTRARAEDAFGVLNPALWPENAGGAAICNDCCEDNPGGEHPQG